MTTIDIRPRFRLTVSVSAADLLDHIEAFLEEDSAKVVGRVSRQLQQVVLKIPHDDRHYWSPQLQLSLRDEKDGTEIRGLFGPRSSVWLLFVFGYSVLGIISLFIGITGGAQAALGQSAPVLWVIPICAVAAIVLYLTAKAGERLGQEEMKTLHTAFQTAVNKASSD